MTIVDLASRASARSGTPARTSPPRVTHEQFARRLSAGTIVLLGDSETGLAYAMAPARSIEAFTLERLEMLATHPATLILGAALLRRFQLCAGQSVDAARGIDDGSSGADRARTMRVASSMSSSAVLRSPGHVAVSGGGLTAITGLGIRFARRHATAGCEAFALAPLCTPDGGHLHTRDAARDARLSHLPLAFTPRSTTRRRRTLAD